MHRPRTREVPLTMFHGQIVAIDGHNRAYNSFMVANKVVANYTNVGSQDIDRDAVLQKWYFSTLETVCLFLSHGITPAFVFDGDHLEEKANTQDKRKEEKRKDRLEIEELKEILRNASPFDRDPKKIERLKQLLARSNYIAKDEMKKLMDLLLGIGIPVLQAPGDAEQLCASLAREGLVSAVYSEDTDNLVYGCPLMITSMSESYFVEEKNRSFRKATCVLLSDILEDLGWDQPKFIDFCITLGCDFNTRIKGLGPKTAYKLIQEYGSIENYPERYDLTCLKYERCREIFQHTPPVHVIEGDELPVTNECLQVDKQLFFTQGEENLAEYSADSFVRRLWSLYTALPEKAIGKLPNLPKRRIITLRRKIEATPPPDEFQEEETTEEEFHGETYEVETKITYRKVKGKE